MENARGVLERKLQEKKDFVLFMAVFLLLSTQYVLKVTEEIQEGTLKKVT